MGADLLERLTSNRASGLPSRIPSSGRAFPSVRVIGHLSPLLQRVHVNTRTLHMNSRTQLAGDCIASSSQLVQHAPLMKRNRWICGKKVERLDGEAFQQISFPRITNTGTITSIKESEKHTQSYPHPVYLRHGIHITPFACAKDATLQRLANTLPRTDICKLFRPFDFRTLTMST